MNTATLIVVLAAPAVGLALRRLRGRRPTLRADYPLASVLGPARSGGKRRIRRVALATSTIFLTVALLSPTVSVERTVVKPVSGELEVAYRLARPAVVLMVDVSGSMGGTIGGRLKIQAAQEAALKFVEGLPEEVEVGLIAFSDRVELAVPPTSNRTRLRGVIQRMEPTGGTMYQYPLLSAISWLRGYRAFNVTCAAVMVTDGLPADREEYQGLLDDFRDLDVPLHTVFIGPPGDEGDLETKRIAEATGGLQYTASTADQLVESLTNLSSTISETIGRAEFQAEIEVPVTVELNLGEPMAALGLALALLYWAMAQRAEGTVF